MDQDELRAAVREMVRADLADGRTVVADGWILSETEMRLAALVALRR